MKILMAYISVTDQAVSPRDKFLPHPLSSIVEYDLKEKEETKTKKNGTTTTLTGDEEEEKKEEKPLKEGEEKVDEGTRKRPDGDADGQGQPPGPGYGQVPSCDMTGRDGLCEKPSITGEDEDENPVFLGLKVYTKKESVVAISGRVRGGPENKDEDEWEDEGGGDDGDEDEDE
jgi:hypothetical protein